MSWLDDADIVSCDRCGTDVVLFHDPPCPHGYAACAGCGWEAVCLDCKRQAEADMFASGEYSARADPFVDHTPEAKASDDAYWAKTRRGWWDLGRGPRPAGKDAS